MGIFRVGIFGGGGGDFPGESLTGGNFPGGNFPGGNFPRTLNNVSQQHSKQFYSSNMLFQFVL